MSKSPLTFMNSHLPRLNPNYRKKLSKIFKIAATPKTIFEIFHTIPGKITKIPSFTFLFLFLMLEIIRFAWNIAWEELSNRRDAQLSLGESCTGKMKLYALWEVLGTLLLFSLECFYPQGKRSYELVILRTRTIMK